MKKFEFRLEKVLDHRRIVEGEAKDLFLAARIATLDSESRLEKLQHERHATLHIPFRNLQERQDIEVMLENLDDRERHLAIERNVLQNEEEMARERWYATRRDVKVMERLREKALEEWQLLASVEEQNALDEWAVTRRAS